MAHTPDLPHFFEENINLEGLFDILSPKNNLVLADDMMLSDADGIILRVSENYERNFGFTHDSIVGKSAFDLEANGTFRPCITAEVIRQKKKITATQTINHTHKNVMTVGIPLFDQNGVLKYAVCFNTVSMEQINTIQQNYRHLQDSLQQYTQEIAELRLPATGSGGEESRHAAIVDADLEHCQHEGQHSHHRGDRRGQKRGGQGHPRHQQPGQRPLYRGQLRGAP